MGYSNAGAEGQAAPAATEASRYSFLRRNLGFILVWPVAAVLLALLLWSAMQASLEAAKREIIDDAFNRAASLSRAYAQQLRYAADQLDDVTLDLKYDWEKFRHMLDLQDQKRAGLFSEKPLLYASIIDSEGNVVTSTYEQKRSDPSPNLSGLLFFRTHKAGRTPGLLITHPESGGLPEQANARFSRRLELQDGTFDGVAVATVDPAFLTTFYDAALLGNEDAISVRFTDGHLLATKVGGEIDEGFYRSAPVFPTPAGTALEPGEKFLDGQPRMIAWQKVDKFPLVAITALSEKTVFAPYESMAQARRHAATIGSLLLLLFALTGSALSARLAWRREQQEQVKITYRVATDAANEGFYMVRPVHARSGRACDFRVEDCNDRGAALIGVTRDKIVGHRVSELAGVAPRLGLPQLFSRAMESGFYEDEIRVPANSGITATWLYRRLVRSGAGLAFTLRDISEEKAHEQALSALANTDALTALPNRHWLSNYLPRAVEEARRHGAHLAVLFIDLDNFKNINDTMGHDAGDELLRQAGARLKDAVRASDHVVRLGGDEFMIVLEQVEATEDASRVAQAVVETIGAPFSLAGSSGQRINASVGISIFPKDGADSGTLVKHADVAMYAAKAAGKGRYRFYEPRLSDGLVLKLDKEQALRAALEQDQFTLHYQPRLRTHNGELVGMEALVRWNHPDRGVVLPAEFVDIADDSGLIGRLDELVAGKACAQLAQWKAQKLDIVPVSINVSARWIVRGGFCAALSRHLARHDLNASLLQIELTESSMFEKNQTFANELAALRALGVKLLVDDFGSGCSSLAQLQRFDVDALKVDRTLTRMLPAAQEGAALFSAIVSMAGALGITVVAEGVETVEQLEALQAVRCDEVQGYLLSKPVPAGEVSTLLLKRFFSFPRLRDARS